MKIKLFLLVATVVGVSWASLAVFNSKNAVSRASFVALPMVSALLSTPLLVANDKFPRLDGAVSWINSPPLTPAELRGKVVLIDFWTYTCINWRREFPYVRAWAQKYKDSGLIVIGVHSPEFAFEKDVDNVRRAAKAIGVDYPIAVDNDHAIWRAFRNSSWPALYFIDAEGQIRHRHFGEGDYDKSERVIQQLLMEAGAADFGPELVAVEAGGAEAAANWQDLKSPETYLGYGRAENFASPGGSVAERRHVYSDPGALRLNQWALRGEWTVRRDAALLGTADGRISYRFHARDLHLVMGPSSREAPVRFRVLIDGHPPGAARGVDVDEQGNGIATDQRMYQLIRQSTPVTDRRFEIEFLDPGAEVFAFTFG